MLHEFCETIETGYIGQPGDLKVKLLEIVKLVKARDACSLQNG